MLPLEGISNIASTRMILLFVKAAFKIHAVAVCLGPQFATSLSSQPVLLDYVWGGIKEGSAYKGSMSDLPLFSV